MEHVVFKKGTPAQRELKEERIVKFREFLREIFDHPYEWKHDPKESFRMKNTSGHLYRFKSSDGKGFRVEFHHEHHPDIGDHTAQVTFMRDSGEMGIEGDQKERSNRVFSTVGDIIKHHIANHHTLPSMGEAPPTDTPLRSVSFSAHDDEPSRVKLYDALAKKHGFKRSEFATTVDFRKNVR